MKSGGQFGIACSGLTMEFAGGVPESLKPYWHEDMFSFHSRGWWKDLWEKTGIVNITGCYDIADAKEIWRPWAEWAKTNLIPRLINIYAI